jgi:hypothetical protein
MALQFAFGSLNVHRLDCNRDHHHPCDPWEDRASRVGELLREEFRCSVYALQECRPEQAADLVDLLGWGDATNPAYAWDENQNVVAYDRDKWTDVGVYHLSLSHQPGDKGDQHRRSVLWVLLEHLDSGERFWAGSSHLENGDGEEREKEAARLVQLLPPEYPAALGIDRNSYTTGEGGPRDTFEDAGMTELDPDNPEDQRSFNNWDGEGEPNDGKSIDGQHYLGLEVRDGRMVYTVNLDATDHNGLVGNLTLP